jgi:Secretion system C-terminal sorting domain
MKTKLLLVIALFISLYSFTQTNGWYLYTKASTIHKIVPDDTNSNELHLATDIGYIKYNTTTNQVTNFLNLTTQNPAIGHVNGLSLNPTNTDIALALDDGIAIYNGTTVTIYNYTNSALTVGSVGGTQFTKLEVRYGRQGELYIFKPDVTGYQVFNAGVFDAEVVTAIRPQDIIENQAGTKVFFAGWNDGLHMLEKATTTWTNYTTSNSVLITNSLLSLQVDASDVLYIGSFQGLNTMDSSAVWNTYQQSAPPPNAAFFLPVYDISVDETTGDLLIRTSKAGTSFFGLSTVILNTNTWTNYSMDNTNCLNASVFTTTAVDANGKIYAAPQDNSNPGQFIEFAPGTNTCTPLDINYLNAPTAVNSGLISSFNVRKKASGNLDIGFTRGENLHILEIDPVTFIGSFTIGTTIVPVAGKSVFSVIADNDFFIVETNTGWVFVDGTNNTTEYSHNLPSYLALGTKKAAAFDSSNGIINLIFKGWDAAFNYRVYKTQCNTATATCSAPEEIFTNNRDFSKNPLVGSTQSRTSNEVIACAIKSDSSVNTALNCLQWEGTNSPTEVFDVVHPDVAPIIPFVVNKLLEGIIVITALADNTLNGNTIDIDGVRINTNLTNEVLVEFGFENLHDKEADAKDLTLFSGGANIIKVVKKISNKINQSKSANEGFVFQTSGSISPTVTDDLQDMINDSARFVLEDCPTCSSSNNSRQINVTKATLVLLTNYGLLIKTGIDISSFLLKTDNVSLKDTNLLLYPNPANDMVNFSDNSIKTIAVYDINGRKVLSTTNSNSFSVKTLAQGIYIVKGTSDNNVVVTKKLIVE